MNLSIQGKTAIVTGASRGIGLAIAKELVEYGANVMFADSNESALESQMWNYDTENGTVRYFSGDIAERLAMANLLSATIDAFDRVDILINAHHSIKSSDPLDTDTAVLDEMLRQNTTSVLRLSQLVANRMIKQAGDQTETGASGGAIVNISTLAATRQVPEMLACSIAGAAQEQVTRGLALALAPHRIRVNGVSFNSVMSHELQCALKDDSELRDKIVAMTPLGRIASAEEVADTAIFLASEGARFVTGRIITVDGGRSLSGGHCHNK